MSTQTLVPDEKSTNATITCVLRATNRFRDCFVAVPSALAAFLEKSLPPTGSSTTSAVAEAQLARTLQEHVVPLLLNNQLLVGWHRGRLSRRSLQHATVCWCAMPHLPCRRLRKRLQQQQQQQRPCTVEPLWRPDRTCQQRHRQQPAVGRLASWSSLSYHSYTAASRGRDRVGACSMQRSAGARCRTCRVVDCANDYSSSSSSSSSARAP
jgi:hypothetical protein